MFRSASRTPTSLKSYLEDAEGSWLETWRMGSSFTSWIIMICDSWLGAKFHLSMIFRSVSRTPCPWSHTWRTLMIPDLILGGWGHSWHHGSLWLVILYLCAKSQLCSMIISVSRTPNPRSHTWRMLMVLDWMIGKMNLSRHCGLSLYVILDLCAKFQLSNMNRSVKHQ